MLWKRFRPTGYVYRFHIAAINKDKSLIIPYISMYRNL